MGYDSSGRLTSRRDPRGNVPDPPAGYLTQWAYDEVDHLSTLTDARGNETDFAYDANELLASETRTDRDSTSRVTSFQYDAANRLWKTTAPSAATPEIRLYWPDGKLKSVESPEERTTSYAYDDAGELETLVEPNGNEAGATASDWTWTYGYDDAGNRSSESHPDGGTRTVDYDALDRPTEWTDEIDGTHSRSTSVDYDANSNVTKRTDGLGNFATYGYDKLNRLTSYKDERQLAGDPWTYTYYPSGELKCVTSPKGFVTNYGIDNDGRTNSMIDPRADVACGGSSSPFTWQYGYDEEGNRTSVSDPLGNEVDYGYNALDQLESLTDQRGNETTLSYDVMNRLWKVTPPAAGGTGALYTEYAYDPRGNLASRVDPNGHETTWTSDLDGLVTQRTTPVGTWNYGYFANGTLKTLESPAGSSTPTSGDGTTTYDYDRMSRLSSVDYSDSTPDVSRSYDLAGRPASMSDGFGSLTYSYDDADHLSELTRSGGGAGLNGSFAYQYDEAGNITDRTYPDSAAASAGYDEDGRLTSISAGSATTSFGYDEANNLTTVTLPSGNGHVATRSFDDAGRLTGVENAKGATVLSQFDRTLDEAGNPTVVETTRGTSHLYDAYEYDTRNRLTASCFDVGSSATDCGSASNEIDYAYDKVSNRTQEVRTGSVGNTGTIDYSYNSADQLTQTDDGTNTVTYGYDDNGNLASRDSDSFSYDLANDLTSATVGGTTTDYGYDGDGNRVSSSTSGGADLRFGWDELAPSGLPELALERDSSGDDVRGYLDGPLGAISMTNASGTFYYHSDPLGSITDVTDASGNPQWSYSYEAYGASLAATDVSGTAPVNPLRFEGQYLEPETELYDLRARQYDPALGRFDALDPLEGPLNTPNVGPYVYANGQPTVLADPLGTSVGSWVHQHVVDPVAQAGETAGTVAKDTSLGFAYDVADSYRSQGGGLDGVLAAIDTANPFGRMRQGAEQAYQEGGALGAVNYFNPMYRILASGDACLRDGSSLACLDAGLSAAFLAAGTACLLDGPLASALSRLPRSDALGSAAAEDEVDVATQLHHADPKFMGGDPGQPLTEMTQAEHQALHQDMNSFLRNEEDGFGNHMRPQRGNSGADIRANFTRTQRLDAVARFYSGPGAKHTQAAADFFAQHPGLAP